MLVRLCACRLVRCEVTGDRRDSELMSLLGRYRHALAVLYVLVTAGFAFLVAQHSLFALGLVRVIAMNGLDSAGSLGKSDKSEPTLIAILIFVAIELIFVLGVGRLTRKRRRGGRPMLAATLAIAAGSVLLLAGSVFFVGAELVDRLGGEGSARTAGTYFRDAETATIVFLILFVLAVWAIWWVTIFLVLRGGGPEGRERALRRAVWTVLAGSWFNVIAALAVDAGIRRQEKNPCYCSQGTFWSLLIGIPLLLLSIGPAIVLIYRHHQSDPAAARRTVWRQTKSER